MKRAILSLAVVLPLLGFARPAAAMRMPLWVSAAMICENSGCTFLPAQEAMERAAVLGLPAGIEPVRVHGGLYFWFLANTYSPYLVEWHQVGSMTDMPVFETRPIDPETGGLSWFHCTELSTTAFTCQAGTAGPGWSWVFHSWYGW